jgi:hypothetical protein
LRVDSEGLYTPIVVLVSRTSTYKSILKAAGDEKHVLKDILASGMKSKPRWVFASRGVCDNLQSFGFRIELIGSDIGDVVPSSAKDVVDAFWQLRGGSLVE